MNTNETCHRGSGNVYKDLGFPDAEEMQAKAVLASRIVSILEHKRWTQEKSADTLKISQSKISLLTRGQLSGFSMEKLIYLLNRLHQDVEITIKNRPTRRGLGHLNVVYAT